MDGVEPHQADEDQIDGDDVVQQPRHDQDQNAGNEATSGVIWAAVMTMDFPRVWERCDAAKGCVSANRQGPADR